MRIRQLDNATARYFHGAGSNRSTIMRVLGSYYGQLQGEHTCQVSQNIEKFAGPSLARSRYALYKLADVLHTESDRRASMIGGTAFLHPVIEIRSDLRIDGIQRPRLAAEIDKVVAREVTYLLEF